MSNPTRFDAPRYTSSSYTPAYLPPLPMPSSFQPYKMPNAPLAGRIDPISFPTQPLSFQPPSNSFAPSTKSHSFTIPPPLPPTRSPSQNHTFSMPTHQMPTPIVPSHHFTPTPPSMSTPSFQAHFPSVPSTTQNFATSYQPITPSIHPLDPASFRFTPPTFSGSTYVPPALSMPSSFPEPRIPSLNQPPLSFDNSLAVIPSPLRALTFTFPTDDKVRQSYRRQIEQNLKMAYQFDAPPERPFPSMPFMAFQINRNITLLADPSIINDLFHHTTSAQKWALQSQFSEIMDRVSHSSQFSESIAVIAVPTAHIPSEASPGKMRKFFSPLGGALQSTLSETTHQVWAFVGPMNEEVVRTKDYIATIMGRPPEQQSSEITRNGHQRIDEFFKTSLAFRHDPDYNPPIPITIVGLPLPMPGGGALVGRVGPLRAGSVGANAVRTGSIASEAIKDVAAVKRSGAVGRELIAVKNISQPSSETRVGGAAQKVINNTASTIAPQGEISGVTRTGRIDPTRINEKKLFNFTETAAKHMNEAERMVPARALEGVIKSPMAVVKDPKGASNAMMHYSQIWKNGKLYNVEVLYDKTTNTISHFQYTQKPIGPLKKVSK